MMRFVLWVGAMLTFAASLHAQQISPEQIQQFRNLPPQQQRMLAQQLGIDYNQIAGFLNQTPGSQQNQQTPATAVYPRGTQFDEYGQPLGVPAEMEAYLETDDDELKPYGIELFASAPSTFAPMYDAPVPADYILGPGDTISIQIYGKDNQQYDLVVTREGSISIPDLGPFKVAGKSYSEMKAELVAAVKRQIIGVDVSVSMGELRSIRVFVLGEAYKPGAYTISSLSTITHALFASGGVTDIASLRNIQLKRAGKLVTTLDLYDLMMKGDSRNDLVLQSGDVVFLPAVDQTVTIDGQVRRPAIYELKGETTLQQAIDLAGGLLADGYSEGIGVTRPTPQGKRQLTLDINKVNQVADGDEIYVAKISDFVDDSVTLIGAVARPGKYQWSDGMRLTDILQRKEKDLLPDTDLTYALVVREINASGDIKIIQVDLTNTFNIGDEEHNPELHRSDRLLVFSKRETESLSAATLDDLAFTNEQLEEKEKEQLENLIEEKVFLEQLGLNVSDEDEEDLDRDEESELLAQQSLFELSQGEKDELLEFKDVARFSRKRMLSPLIAQLQEQSRAGKPLQLVEIAGAVRYPGVYPLPEDGEVLDIIKAAGGLMESAFGEKSEITKTVVSATGAADIQHIQFSPRDVMTGRVLMPVESKDRINIFNIPEWQEELKVTLSGEFAFPGEYTIRRGELLSNLIERAGGLTSFGSASAAVFTRESLKAQEEQNIRRLAEDLRKDVASEGLRRNNSAGALVSYDDARKLLRDLTRVEAVGRLVIDLDDLLAGNENRDVILEDGDMLHIPAFNKTVNVIGEVYVPTSHLFDETISFEDYIELSGGFKDLADKNKVYIIRANGSVTVPSKASGFWFSSSNNLAGVRPGDTVVVPYDSSYVDNTTLWTNATQILYQLAVAVAAIGSL